MNEKNHPKTELHFLPHNKFFFGMFVLTKTINNKNNKTAQKINKFLILMIVIYKVKRIASFLPIGFVGVCF
jgi:hypothetical protein